MTSPPDFLGNFSGIFRGVSEKGLREIPLYYKSRELSPKSFTAFEIFFAD
jgi:hypothetical protein